MKVPVTGIAGFAGSHLADWLLASEPPAEFAGLYRPRLRRTPRADNDSGSGRSGMEVRDVRMGWGQRRAGCLALLYLAAVCTGAAAEVSSPGGGVGPTDRSRVFRVEVGAGDSLLLDGQAVPWSALRASIAARSAESPPVIYRVMLPASLECACVEEILAAIGAEHKATGRAAQCAFAPVLLGLAGTDDLDAVAVTVPTRDYRFAPFKVADARVIDIVDSGESLVDGVPCHSAELPDRLSWLAFSSAGTARRFPVDWVYLAARNSAPFSALYAAVRASRHAEIEHLSLWDACALINPDSLAGRRPPERRAAEPPAEGAGCGLFAAFDEPPSPIYRVYPDDPDPGSGSGLGGEVKVHLLINEFGEAYKAEPLHAEGPECLIEAALRAGRQWRFLPGRQRQIPTRTSIVIPFVFEAPHLH